MMENKNLNALSAVDGRYHDKTQSLQAYFSESALIKYRLNVEIAWFKFLLETNVTQLPKLSSATLMALDQVYEDFSLQTAVAVKEIERVTNHDVKAIEYYLKKRMADWPDCAAHIELVHFALTSEDVNNLAYAMMLRDAMRNVMLPTLDEISTAILKHAQEHVATPMLSRTHGQAASPTTLGKELVNVHARFAKQFKQLVQQPYYGKCNGAVGNFNAHVAALPSVDWQNLSQTFVESLGLVHNPLTTQIEPHDFIAELCHSLAQINTILIDFNRDIWGYISLGYFKQRISKNEVGSSTMPHKVNPIDFENSEGNLGVANALLYHLAQKLPISRWQRDLSDSTTLRTLGTTFGHNLIAFKALIKGLSKLDIDRKRLSDDLAQRYEVLAEAIQSAMRLSDIDEPYEKLKALTRGKQLNQASYHEIIRELKLSDDLLKQLQALSPSNYTGQATEITETYLSSNLEDKNQ